MNGPKATYMDILILEEAGLSPEEIALCNERYQKVKNRFSYEDWCKAYAALNSKQVMEGGPMLDGNIIINALLANKKNGKPKRKVFKLGSYSPQQKSGKKS